MHPPGKNVCSLPWKHAPALPGGINSLKQNQISIILVLAPFVTTFNIFFFNVSVSESLVRENVSHYQLRGCQTWEVFVSYCSPCPSCCAGFVPEPEMRRALGKRCYRVGGWLAAPLHDTLPRNALGSQTFILLGPQARFRQEMPAVLICSCYSSCE